MTWPKLNNRLAKIGILENKNPVNQANFETSESRGFSSTSRMMRSAVDGGIRVQEPTNLMIKVKEKGTITPKY